MSDLEELKFAFIGRYTEAFVRELSCEGTKLLKDIARMETFGGRNMVIRRQDGPRLTTVLLERAFDYERPQFGPIKADMFASCDKAIRELGRRLDLCLQGEAVAKDFGGQPRRSNMWPASKWPEGACLYSLGPAPQALDYDGITLFHVPLDGHDGSDDTPPKYRDDLLEARFGYYANCGPIGDV
jgi:hypothetical protein